MSVFCIPKHLVTQLKESALKGEIDIKKLYNMSSAERRDFFTKHTDSELGKFINTEFEKAMVSKQKSAITNWAQNIFSPKEKTKPVFKSVLDKINSLDELGVLNSKTEKAFLEDLVSDKLGINVTADEIKIIADKVKPIQEAQLKLGDEFGNPAKEKELTEFLVAKKKMDDYLLGLNPASNLKIFTGTIGRGMMLFSVKSPILNIGSNIEIGLTEAISRRVSTRGLTGADNKLASNYVGMVNRIYQKTGYDISRMTSFKDTGASGERVLGDTVHTQGTGPVRKTGQVIEDIVFKQLMGAPDVAFSSLHFADSVNLNSLKFAKGDKIKAKSFMEDSMRLEPRTPEGEVLRAQALLDAQIATWTDTTWASKVSTAIRKIINQVSGDLRLGDITMPFIKTPANVIATGMDYAGTGIPKAIIKTVKALKSRDMTRENLQGLTRDLTRVGLGLTGAFIISSQLKDEDFVGAYDPKRAQIEQLRNSNYNAIRIGDKWVSTDWLGPLMVPLTAMMYARKYGDTVSEKTFQYGKGVAAATLNIPGIRDIYDFVKTQSYKKNQNLEEMTGETADYLSSEIYSRLVPSIMSDTAKMIDPYQRQGGKGIAGIKAKIPILRETLPIKKDVFGKEVEGESGLSTLLFGTRVKTDKETALITEINKVSNATDKSINFTNWDNSPSKTLKQFKEKVGEETFKQAKTEYGKTLQYNLEIVMNKSYYQRATDEQKAKLLNNMDSDVMDKILKRYKFHYKREKIGKLLPRETIKGI
jgi:hypothetical protein